MSNPAVLARLGLRRADTNPLRAWMVECPQLNTLAHLCEAFEAIGHPLPRPNFSRWARRDNWTLPNCCNRFLLEEASFGQIPATAWLERLPPEEQAARVTSMARRLITQRR